jgi:hypothetical protein
MFIGYSILLNYISVGYFVILDFFVCWDILSEWTICHAGHYVIGFLVLWKCEEYIKRKHWKTYHMELAAGMLLLVSCRQNSATCIRRARNGGEGCIPLCSCISDKAVLRGCGGP